MGIKLSEYLVKLGRRDYYKQPMIGHWCPACAEVHAFSCEVPQDNGAKWAWNGDAFYPTFSPSMNIITGPFEDGHKEVCHYFLKGGMIQFLSDCTHRYAGVTTPLEPIPLGRMSSILAAGS